MHCNKTGKNHPELSARRKGGWFLFCNQESWCMYIKRICQIFDSGILKSSHQTTYPLRPSQRTQTIKQNHWVILNDEFGQSQNPGMAGYGPDLSKLCIPFWTWAGVSVRLRATCWRTSCFWGQRRFVSRVRCFYMHFFCMSHALRITDVLAKMAIASKVWEISLA